MREQRKSFTSFVILGIGVVVFLLVAAGCQSLSSEKLPDGAKRHLDELIGTGRYRIVSAEKGSNPKGVRLNSDEVWCVVLNGSHRGSGEERVNGDYSILMYRTGNLWDNVWGTQYTWVTEDTWLMAGCSEDSFVEWIQ